MRQSRRARAIPSRPPPSLLSLFHLSPRLPRSARLRPDRLTRSAYRPSPSRTNPRVCRLAQLSRRGRLAYGVALKTTSAIIASRAWPRVKRIHRFVALISARKTAGTLALESDARATRLPEVPREVWDAIARHVAHEIYREEEDRFVFSIHGTSDDGLWDELQTQAEEGNAPAGIDDRMGRARLDLSHLHDCDTCSLMMAHEYGTVHTLSGSTEVRSYKLPAFQTVLVSLTPGGTRSTSS